MANFRWCKVHRDVLKTINIQNVSEMGLRLVMYVLMHLKKRGRRVVLDSKTVADYFGCDRSCIQRARKELVDIHFLEKCGDKFVCMVANVGEEHLAGVGKKENWCRFRFTFKALAEIEKRATPMELRLIWWVLLNLTGDQIRLISADLAREFGVVCRIGP